MRGVVRVGLVAVGVLAALALLGVVVLVIVVNLQNRPPVVPPGFRAPARLPASTVPAATGELYYDSQRTGSYEIYLAPTPGADPRRLTDDDAWDSWWPRLSPDRRHVLFYRSPRGVHDTDFGQTHLWVMAADGSAPTELRPPGLDGWVQQGHAEWAPDSSSLVMFGGNRTNPQIFVTDPVGQRPRPVTNRPGTNIDPSFAPDGRTIAFVGCPQALCTTEDYEVYLTAADGGDGANDARRLTDDDLRDHDPYFSPDGSRLAWLTQTSTAGRNPGGAWNIRLAAADGSGLRRVTDDDEINSKPEWSRDGTTIYFHRLDPGRGVRRPGFSIFAVRPDGTGLREVTAGQPGINEFPST